MEMITLNGTIIQSGRAHVGVGSFAEIMKAAFMINNQTEGFTASGESPPDGHVIPVRGAKLDVADWNFCASSCLGFLSVESIDQYVIHNIPPENVVSRQDWLDYFTKQGIDTIVRIDMVRNN